MENNIINIHIESINKFEEEIKNVIESLDELTTAIKKYFRKHPIQWVIMKIKMLFDKDPYSEEDCRGTVNRSNNLSDGQC